MRFFTSVLLCLGLPFASLHAQEIVTLDARDGVTQSYLLLKPAMPAPHAIAVLFPGGGGNIRLRLAGAKIRFGSDNFLVRSREEFVRQGLAAAVIDAPSDRQSGMEDEFRAGPAHLRDIQAVLADLGRALGNGVSGVVLTAAVYLPSGRRAQHGDAGLSGFDFAIIKAPLLLVHHRSDGCSVTPYHAAQRLAGHHPLISVSGGKPAESAPCQALSEHGFLGREAATVESTVNWMLKKPYRTEID